MSRYEDVVEDLHRRVANLDMQEHFDDLNLAAAPVDSCNSPIEKLFVLGLLGQEEVLSYDVLTQVGAERGPYVIDVLLSDMIKIGPDLFDIELAVEIDGREWHERSADQGQRDRQRDRQLLREFGIPTLRFMGSEVYRDPFATAAEAIETMESYHRRLRTLGRAVPDRSDPQARARVVLMNSTAL